MILKENFFTLSFDWTERIEGSTNIDGQAIALLWQGGNEFIGQDFTFEDNRVATMIFRELALGWAIPILEDKPISVRLGGRLKYLWGTGAISSERANISTQIENNSIQVSSDYSLFTSLNDNDFRYFENAGSGFGIDLGVSVGFSKNFLAHVAFLDIGGIQFNQSLNTYTQNTSFAITGTDFDLLNENIDDPDITLDNVADQFEPIESEESFSQTLPTRMMLQAEYRVEGTDKQSRLYPQHQVFLTYLQGLSNIGAASTRPQLTAAYAYNLKNTFNTGASLSFGGFSRFNLGIFASVRLGAFRFGVGSNTLNYFISPGNSYANDFTFSWGLSF